MSKPHILVIGENIETHADHLAQAFTVHLLSDKPDREAYIDEVAPKIEALALSGGAAPRCDAALLDRLPNLSLVASLGVGHSMVDVDAVKARGIMATHGPGSNAASVADFALGLILSVTRRIIPYDRYARAGQWAATGLKGGYTTTLTGKTVGIVGLGHIGSAVARRAAGFDTEILYHQRHVDRTVPYRHVADLRELAEVSHYLVTCCPATPETRHMVDADVLRALGRDGYLISVSRGAVIDEAAMIEALQSGAIAGAGLEVFENEPHIPAALTAMDNVVLSPHRSAFTHESTQLMRDMILANLTAHFAGRPVPNPIPGFEHLVARRVRA